MTTRRREVLRTLAALGVGGALAGCQSDGDGTTATNETATNETTAGPTGTATPEEPDDSDSQSMEPAQLKQRARDFVQLLADGEFETAHGRFTDTTAGQISVDRLERAWKGTAGQKGDLQEILSVEYSGENNNGLDVVVVRGQFTQGTQQFNFAFAETGIASFRIVPDQQAEYTPPSYVDESAFSERELTLSAPGDCSLGATLSVPNGDGEVPGVVLVHGNGAQDRDETIGPNKTFKDIAWGLASRGIAVLRYDKRTETCDVALADATIDDVVTDDALTALDRLRSVDRVGDVFVAGHSFGGAVAPRIAQQDGNVAGVVMLAPGPAVGFAEAIVRQTRHLAELDGTVTDAEQRSIDRTKQVAERIRTLDIGDDEVLLNFGGDEYYRSYQEYDQAKTFANLDVPRYVAQGGSDWQVTVEEDLQVWRDAAGDQASVTIEVYPDLNHHFQVSTGKETRAEYTKPDNHVAKRLVTDVAAFITSTA